MYFLSDYYQLRRILINDPPKVSVIFHEKRLGALARLHHVVRPSDYFVHKKVPADGLVSKCVSEIYRRHEIPRSKIGSFLFENVNFLDDKEILAIKSELPHDSHLALVCPVSVAEMRIFESGVIPEQYKGVIKQADFSVAYFKNTETVVCVGHTAIPCFYNYKFLVGK